jgi:translation initiation factor 1 (eIF-1/SUI1)
MAALFSLQNLDFDSIGSIEPTTETKSCKISILNGKGKKKCTQIEIPNISSTEAKIIQKAISTNCGLRGNVVNNIISIGGKDVERIVGVIESFGITNTLVEDLSTS